MKKLIMAGIILVSAAGLFGSMRVESARIREQLTLTQRANHDQATQLEAARAEQQTLDHRVQELRTGLRAARAAASLESGEMDSIAARVMANQSLTPEQREKFLAELGCHWNNTGDYLVVSKETLHQASLTGMQNSKLAEAACGVLAMTPAERSAIEAAAQKVFADYSNWMKANIQRSGPQGNVVCEYKVKFDEIFSQSASNAFTARVFATLGVERGSLLLDYCSEWMDAMSMRVLDVRSAEATTLTVNQYNKNEPRYLFTIKAGYSVMTTEISPWQPFPEAFKPMFPNGWADLAKAESFELPPAFAKQKAQ